ncbi:hypothetical protein QR680_005722 [Steinernema hermaphroditum]|uniref:Protein kinase domain-containing protein n=1 Tax=Steinernema hermaphroditum TaxID=289476 RepID=A0AA39LW81_9BILA|nr:hypothetical protein QR680_005722 [Steinernema hermaphroditum]
MRFFSLLLALLLLHLHPVADAFIEDTATCPIDTNPLGCERAVGEVQFWTSLVQVKRHCNQRFIIDLTCGVTSRKNYNVVIDFIYQTLNSCSDKGIGRSIFFNPLGLYNETVNCCSEDGCKGILTNTMRYDKYLSRRNDTAVFQKDVEDNNVYFVTLSLDLKSMQHFQAEGTVASTVLITDRVYTRFGDYVNQINAIFDRLLYTKFTVVLVGRPEVSTTDFRRFYNGIANMDVFSVPDFQCLPQLANCVEPCAAAYCRQFQNSSEVDICAFPTPPPATAPSGATRSRNPGNSYKYELIYVFDISCSFPESLFGSLKEDMALPLKACFNKTLGVSVVSVQTPRPPWIYTGMDLQIQIDALDYFFIARTVEHPIDDKEGNTLRMMRNAVEMIEATPGGTLGRMIVLVTDYVSEEFVQMFNSTLHADREVDLRIVALNDDTRTFYDEYINASIVSSWDGHGARHVDVCNWLTNDTVEHKEQKKAPSSSVSTVLFISVGTCSALLVVLIGCTVLYRQKFITIKNIQKFREKHDDHQRPEADNVIDYWELSWDKLVVKMEKLGSGAYGQVYRGKLVGKAPAVEKFYTNLPMNRSWENCDVAIKMLPKYATDQARKEFMNEIELMKNIGYNDNIVNMLGCITVGNPVGLVLEYCANRDMLHYLKGRKVDIQLSNAIEDRVNYTKDLLLFAWQIADGMNYLGSKNVVHRDLAARNILVDSENNAKIGDFGLCMNMNAASTGSVSRREGVFVSASGRLPIKWLALECLQKHEFSQKSDVWSYGILLYEMYTFGGTPFQGIEPDRLLEYLEAGGRPERPDLCNEEMYEIMHKCWRASPEDRPSFQELLTIFTVLLERATENYGYLSLLKAGGGTHRTISRLARSFCMSERSFRREARTATESTIASSHYDYPERPFHPALAPPPQPFFYNAPPESDLEC